MSVDSVKFSKTHWPKIKPVKTIEINLTDLWDDDEGSEQATVFIAEALIADPPMISIDSFSTITTYVWECGGDCLTVSEKLSEALENCLDALDIKNDNLEQRNQSITNLKNLQTKLNEILSVLECTPCRS